MSIAFYLTFHQIMPCDMTKELMGMVQKLQAVVVFLASKETKSDVDTTTIILSYLCHFGNVSE